MEGIQLPAALALLLGADLFGSRQWPLEGKLELGLACDLAADVTDDAAEPAAQQAQLPMVALELLGVRIAPRHHRSMLGDAQIGLSQSHAALMGHTIEPLDRRVQQLGVGREGDGLGLHRGVDRHPLEVARVQRTGVVRDPQALGEQQLQLVAQPLPPMAQVRALMRERVLEKLLAGEVLEIRVVDPAVAHRFVGQPVNVLEQ